MRVVVLASGTGTLLQAIMDSAITSDAPVCDAGDYSVVAVVSDKQCPAIDRSQRAGVPTAVVELGQDRQAWNQELVEVVTKYEPDLVVSAGFMRILGKDFVDRFAGKVINTHPALLPSFPGAHAVRDALAYGVKVTGSTVHVVDEGVDTGPILAQAAVSVEADDTEDSLHERIKIIERELIVSVIQSLQQKRFAAS